MEVNIFYIVESQFWRSKIGDKLESLANGLNLSDTFVKTKKEFRQESPIEARKMAFNHYQSIIDVLYDGLGEYYKNDYQARIDLQYYLDSNNDVEFGNTTKFKVTDDFLNGIEVYMIVERPQKENKTKITNRCCIHGIRYVDYPERLDEDLIATLKNLFIENQCYEENSYPSKKERILKHFDSIGGGAEFLLQTPFDWDILMKEFQGQNLLRDGSL